MLFFLSVLSAMTQGIPHAFAYGQGILNMVGQGVSHPPSICSGTGCLGEIIGYLEPELFAFTGILASVFITVAAVRLLSKSSEDEVSNARRAIGTVFIGVVLAVLSNAGFLRNAAVNVTDNGAIQELCGEFLGVIALAVGVSAIIAVIAIAATGIKVLASFGEADAAADMRRAVGATVAGAFILGVKSVVFPAIGIGASGCTLTGTVSPNALVNHVLSIIVQLIVYLEVVAIFILVILGILMIVNLGNEENFSKLKSYLFRLAIGFIVLAMSHILLSVVVQGTF